VCRRFEAAWQAASTADQRPRIEAYLDAVAEGIRGSLLQELVALEIDLRREAGEDAPEADYWDRFPLLNALDRTAPSNHVPAAPAAANVHISGYEIVQELGRGGMGVVYWAWETSLRRPVALKMILAGAHASQAELARFQTEAEAIGRLHHPNIVQVYHVATHQGCPYMAMEYVDGGTLGKHIGETPQAARAAAQLVLTLTDAVHYAHQHGIVHRDLTPGNVLLQSSPGKAQGKDGDEDGNAGALEAAFPKITDFGLAKLVIGGGPTLTDTGAVLGTPSYMAPEQTLSGSSAIGPATDVYALGAILYQLLTGRPPFKAASAVETVLQVQLQEPVSPHRLQPRLPRDLTTIVMKCLAKEPARRYGRAQALGDDLRRFLAGEPVHARPVGRIERLWRTCRRYPVVSALTATVLLLLGALVVGTLVKNAQLASALTDSEEANRNARALLWESLRDRARALRMSRAPGQRLQSLESIRKAVELPVPLGHTRAELQTEAIAALALPDIEVVQQWTGYPPGHVALQFDQGLTRYARLGADGKVSVLRIADNSVIAGWKEEGSWAGRMSGQELPLLFSPDGRYLAVRHFRPGRVSVRRLDGPAGTVCCRSAKVSANEARALSFSPDSSRLAYVRPDGRLVVADLRTSKEELLAPSDAAEIWDHLWFAPDGRRLAVKVRRQNWAIDVVDAATGKVQQTLLHPSRITDCAWHPDGQTLATTGDDKVIRLWQVASRGVVRELKGHKDLGICCAFSRSGDRLLSNDWAGLLRVWDPSSGRQLLSFPADNYNYLRVSPEDRLPAVDPGDPTRVQIIQLYAGLEHRSIAVDHAKLGRALGFDYWAKIHPRGQMVAASVNDQSVAIVDLRAGREIANLGPGAVVPLRWEKTGSLLTCGDRGLLQWPVLADAARPEHFYFGPARQLVAYPARYEWGCSADGQVVAVPFRPQAALPQAALLMFRGKPHRWDLILQPQQDVRNCSVSPDGRWAACGSHGNTDGLGAKVWDTSTGKEPVKELRVAGFCHVSFSPDNRWLLTTGGGCRLWKVGSWEEGPKIGGTGGHSACFSHDGSMLVIADADGALRLVRPESGKTLARLEAPEQARLRPQDFSQDDGQLIALDRDTKELHMWDLGAVRQGLVKLGLEGEMPAMAAHEQAKRAPLEVAVDVK
jgi:serine/threonine protein kinase/WD40 repeat protein